MRAFDWSAAYILGAPDDVTRVDNYRRGERAHLIGRREQDNFAVFLDLHAEEHTRACVGQGQEAIVRAGAWDITS